MSSGLFNTNARYEVFPAGTTAAQPAIVTTCRVQPETLALVLNGVANAAAAGAITIGLPRATISASGRRRGIIRARGVRVRFTGTTTPAGYKPNGIIFLPWMVSATFNALPASSVGTYLGQPVELVGVRVGSVT